MNITQFAEKLTKHNANGYLVGGAVRDKHIGLDPKDRDYCVTGLDQDGFESIFPNAELQGKDFPVYRMELAGEPCEVALARTERKTAAGHRGFAIESNPSVTIQDDLSRRDLTINAMAECLHTGDVVDPFFGQADLQNGVLRATTDAFGEDPLRVYRTARFAAKFGFGVDAATIQTMSGLKSELASLSTERVIEETKKALLCDTPSAFFRSLNDADLLDVHFPEIADLVGLQQNPRFHPEGDVFEHTMQVLDATRVLIERMPVTDRHATMFSALLHDVGKKPTAGINAVTGAPTFHSHEKEGVPIAHDFLKRFKIGGMQKNVLFNVEHHMVMHGAFSDMKPSKAVDFMHGKFEHSGSDYIRKTGMLNVMLPNDFLVICMADVAGRVRDADAVKPIARKLHEAFGEAEPAENILARIQPVVSDATEAHHMAEDFDTVIRHARIVNDFTRASKGITCQQDVAVMSQKLSGEALGHAIHQDKKTQRVHAMKAARATQEPKAVTSNAEPAGLNR